MEILINALYGWSILFSKISKIINYKILSSFIILTLAIILYIKVYKKTIENEKSNKKKKVKKKKVKKKKNKTNYKINNKAEGKKIVLEFDSKKEKEETVNKVEKENFLKSKFITNKHKVRINTEAEELKNDGRFNSLKIKTSNFKIDELSNLEETEVSVFKIKETKNNLEVNKLLYSGQNNIKKLTFKDEINPSVVYIRRISNTLISKTQYDFNIKKLKTLSFEDEVLPAVSYINNKKQDIYVYNKMQKDNAKLEFLKETEENIPSIYKIDPIKSVDTKKILSKNNLFIEKISVLDEMRSAINDVDVIKDSTHTYDKYKSNLENKKIETEVTAIFSSIYYIDSLQKEKFFYTTERPILDVVETLNEEVAIKNANMREYSGYTDEQLQEKKVINFINMTQHENKIPGAISIELSENNTDVIFIDSELNDIEKDYYDIKDIKENKMKINENLTIFSKNSNNMTRFSNYDIIKLSKKEKYKKDKIIISTNFKGNIEMQKNIMNISDFVVLSINIRRNNKENYQKFIQTINHYVNEAIIIVNDYEKDIWVEGYINDLFENTDIKIVNIIMMPDEFYKFGISTLNKEKVKVKKIAKNCSYHYRVNTGKRKLFRK